MVCVTEAFGEMEPLPLALSLRWCLRRFKCRCPASRQMLQPSTAELENRINGIIHVHCLQQFPSLLRADMVFCRTKDVSRNRLGLYTNYILIRGTNKSYLIQYKKVKRYISPELVISEQRGVICHMGSCSVTFHPTQVNSPRLTPAIDRMVLDLICPPTDGHPSKY